MPAPVIRARIIPMPIRSFRRLTHLRDWFIPFALALLLLSQTIALVHRIAHAPRGATEVATRNAGFFADHSANDCRLFDQLAPTDIAPLPVLALSFALHAAPAPVAEHAVPITARLRAFRARDPPVSLA